MCVDKTHALGALLTKADIMLGFDLYAAMFLSRAKMMLPQNTTSPCVFVEAKTRAGRRSHARSTAASALLPK